MSNEFVKSVVRPCVDSLVSNSAVANAAVFTIDKALIRSPSSIRLPLAMKFI